MPPPAEPSPAPILVADSAQAFVALKGSLQGAFAMASATTLEGAKRLLRADLPLVLCDVHFDDGRMYDLLRYMKSQEALREVPFLVLRTAEGQLDDTIYESVKIATRALGANGFVDLLRWRMRHGEVEAHHRLTRCVEELARGTGGPTTF